MKTLKVTILLMLALLLLPFFAKADSTSVNISGVMGLVREVDGKLEVITVDRWESQFRSGFQYMMLGETPNAYAQRAIEQRIRPVDATLASRLDEGLTQVLTTEWVNSTDLKVARREGRIKGDYKRGGWKLVQLLERTTETSKGKPAKVSIRYNRELFKQLHTFDIALLLMHETVFMLNSDLKQRNSYEVRKLVAKLMAHDQQSSKELNKRVRGLDIETSN